ncbi:Aste57867_24950 [Aphanomyces stellatus]|uniref:Aste57867_24950 protein n=1 Tax=Aphanomyces stellatus TaxID=120398 RepID=A0A485LT78_9STRA|nr:hypothetical protein As57867_024872 [Aphanomyces stellatus]VFU01581.1 Aste57867_24950 [Aphanomyces stellatus]
MEDRAVITSGSDTAAESTASLVPLRDFVTVIVTTSAIPSNPSTKILEEVLHSFSFVPELNSCNIILTCDGYMPKAAGGETKFKSMRISDQDAQNYIEYQGRACDVFRRHVGYTDTDTITSSSSSSTIRLNKRKCISATVNLESVAGKPTFTTITVSTRLGFALAVREAVKLVNTPYILIHQHDWTFLHPLNLRSLCQHMDAHPTELQYIGFSTRKSLRRAVRPSLPPAIPRPFGDLHLTPLYFWYDKPHLARTEHYRTFVYGRGRFKVGDFIEDTLGHHMLKDLKTNGAEAHVAYGTWAYVRPDDATKPTLRHRSGRHFKETIFMRTSKKKHKLHGAAMAIEGGMGALSTNDISDRPTSAASADDGDGSSSSDESDSDE